MNFFIWHTLIILFVFFWGACLGFIFRGNYDTRKKTTKRKEAIR